MIIIDINLETFKNLNNKLSANMILYLERVETIELYSFINNSLFRAILKIPEREQERIILYQTEIQGAIKINDISQVNESEWKDYFMGLYNKLEEVNIRLNDLVKDDIIG